jgi:hypothetical protein
LSVSREESRSVCRPGPAAKGPLDFSRPPPPHRGALSVADGVSIGRGHLIYHPSTVDCSASPRPRQSGQTPGSNGPLLAALAEAELIRRAPALSRSS